MPKRIIFFRNDDVGLHSAEPVAKELKDLTNIFLNAQIPICHAVVPNKITKETVNWLTKTKKNYPSLISIGQHGFKHLNHGRGEFGGNRSYNNQKSDIKEGMEILKSYFGPYFSYWFSAPWITYNRQTKRICDDLGFKVFSGGVSPKLHARIFNALGRFLNLNVMIRKEVSYHRKDSFAQIGFKTLEISVSVDVIEDYNLGLVKPLDCIQARFDKCKKCFNVIGILLHQWVFDSPEKLELMRNFLSNLKKDPTISFTLVENIENRNN